MIRVGRYWVAALSLLALTIAPSVAADSLPQDDYSAGAWHLVRTPNPRRGPDAVSISHTADITRSDLNFAGVMVRCGETGPEFIIVVVTPFPPGAQPRVTIGAGGQEWQFDAQIVSPGTQVLLPPEAMKLASGRWQSAPELAVKVTAPPESFAGVVAIGGLSDALLRLVKTCPAG